MSTTTTHSEEQDYKRLLGAIARLYYVLDQVTWTGASSTHLGPMHKDGENLTGPALDILNSEVIPAAEALVTVATELAWHRSDLELPEAARDLAYRIREAGMLVLAAAHAVASSNSPFAVNGEKPPHQVTEWAVLDVACHQVGAETKGMREWGERLEEGLAPD